MPCQRLWWAQGAGWGCGSAWCSLLGAEQIPSVVGSKAPLVGLRSKLRHQTDTERHWARGVLLSGAGDVSGHSM